MFTGIIVEMGEVAALNRKSSGASLSISARTLAKDAVLGDSIAINGACLTVVSKQGSVLGFDLSEETLRSTNLGQLTPGDRINLEPSLRADGKLGGHFVTGHVDAVGKIRSKDLTGEAFTMIIEAPEEVTRLLVEKGSIALDGISLTVVDVSEDSFSVVIIPHTARFTTVGFKSAGATVNLEADIIGKYVARFLGGKVAPGKTTNDKSLMKSLIESGYIRDKG